MFKISVWVWLLALASEATCWTIDLPEARKFIFEKNDRLEKQRLEGPPSQPQGAILSNRYSSNSKHHEQHPYAREYGYREDTVRGVVYKGGEYLEGLRRSLDAFSERLRGCAADKNGTYLLNVTSASPPPWAPRSDSVPPQPPLPPPPSPCAPASRARQHVRRLAALALSTLSELQDLGYSAAHMKADAEELSQRENELVLKLAWCLHRLAHLTGFTPDHTTYYDYPTSTTALPPAASVLNATEDTKLRMMNCLKRKSDVPATVRCAYPQEIPGVVQFLINNSNPAPGGLPSSSNREERVSLSSPPADRELLVASDHRPPYTPYLPYHLLRKRAAPPDIKTNMAADHPTITFMKYFVKHKVWEADNPPDTARGRGGEGGDGGDEVTNVLPHTVRRRAARGGDPLQDLSAYAKRKKGVHHVGDDAQAQRIRDYVEKIRNAKPTSAKEHSRRIAKLMRSESTTNTKKLRSKLVYDSKSLRSKRSDAYESDADAPRAPDDLFEDLSYYAKNKPGTDANGDVQQAARVREGLGRVFLSPNVQTVRRYAANYSPLVPDPLAFAALRSAADN